MLQVDDPEVDEILVVRLMHGEAAATGPLARLKLKDHCSIATDNQSRLRNKNGAAVKRVGNNDLPGQFGGKPDGDVYGLARV